ncbi:MAG: phosphoribosyltransferase family protein [Patescibacteria group bacterium]
MNKSDLIKRLREIELIYKEKVVLRSGEVSDFYCDIKKAFGYPDILNALADAIGGKISEEVTCVAASGYGGLPLASVVASRFNKKFTAVRSSEKNHGKGGMLDGYVPKEDDVVIIIDDVLTSGSSIKETQSALKELGINVDSAIVVVKRGDPELPIPYSFIFTLAEIVEK